ncbi:MAG: hypothetical protein ABIL58_07080 [Pseudomonadota bacterium]
MSNDQEKPKEKDITTTENESQSGNQCCFVVDPCSCYVDPCCGWASRYSCCC